MISSIVKWNFFLVVALSTLSVSFIALEAALQIPTYHLDGAFQTASSLFRIYDGQLPGRDFLPYLGIGITFLLYPFFWFLGADLSASVFAGYFGTLMASGVSIYIVFRLALDRSHRYYALIAGFFFIAYFYFFPPTGPLLFNELVHPGTSLRSLRRFFPYIGLFVCYSIFITRWRPLFKLLGVASVCGVAALWANDFALPSLFVGGLISLYLFIRGDIRRSQLCLLGIAVLVAMALFLMIATGGHLVELLSYNFIDVRHDQYWYFAPWTESSKIFTWADINSKVMLDYYPYIWLLPALFGAAIWLRNTAWIFLCGIGLSLFLGGVLATVGGHKAWYEQSYLIWSYTTFAALVIAALRFLYSKISEKFRVLQSWRLLFAGGAVYAMPILALTFCAMTLSEYIQKHDELKISPGHYFEPSLGGYLTNNWAPYIALAKEHRDNSSLEEYWGLWSAVNRQHGARVDAAIHALGEQREYFFSGQDIVTTTLRGFSAWQAWSLTSNYWLYRELIRGYDVVFQSPTTVVWKKRDGASFQFPEAECELDANNGFYVQSERSGYHEVELVIDGRRLPSRSLIMMQNNINYAWTGGGFSPLDASQVVHRFPVKVGSEGNYFRGVILGGSAKQEPYLIGCKARYIPPVSEHVFETLGYQRLPEVFTDRNWNRGVSRFYAGFFVIANKENLAAFTKGKLVEFHTGEIRAIEKIKTYGRFINIYLDGDILNVDDVGFPAEFKLLSAINEKIVPERHTDGYWVNGYARRGCGFFVQNTQRHRQLLTAGASFTLATGGAIKIERIESNRKYINAFCEGSPLSPDGALMRSFSNPEE